MLGMNGGSVLESPVPPLDDNLAPGINPGDDGPHIGVCGGTASRTGLVLALGQLLLFADEEGVVGRSFLTTK